MDLLFFNKKYLLSLLLCIILLHTGTGLIAQETIIADTTELYELTKAKSHLDTPYEIVPIDEYLGSANTIFTDKLTKTLAPNILSSLSGRLPGLFINQYAGKLQHRTASGVDMNIFIGAVPVFGIGNYGDNSQFNLSLRGQSPVVIIDGVERELFSLDPEVIESVSVQKDALSSLLTGMKSSRGLIVITTKKPKQTGFQVSFTGKIGIEQPLSLPKPLPAYQYAYLMNEALLNDGKVPAYNSSDFKAYREHSSPFTHPDINWYDQILKKQATIQSYNLSASGGGKVAQYFISLGYMNQEGFFQTSKDNSYNTNENYSRYLITSKINVQVTEDFRVNLSLIGRIEDGNQPGAGASSILSTLYNTPNNAYPIFNPNGSYGGTVSFNNNLWAQTIQSGYLTDNARDVFANLIMNYDMGKFLKGLSVKAIGSVSAQSRSALKRSKQMITFQYTPEKDGKDPLYEPYGSMLTQSNDFIPVTNFQYMYGQIGLNYERTFGLHKIGAEVFADIKQMTANFNLPDKPANLYGKINYNYAGKYYAEAAVDRSHYNGYVPGNQWGTFYAFGLGWMLNREPFLSGIEQLNQWKIRGVYGKTASGIDNAGYYIWRQAFDEIGIVFYPQGTSRTNLTLVYEVNNLLANPNISWENAGKLNIGTDINLFNNHLSLTADFYKDHYTDLLISRGKSIELIGMLYPLENIGIITAHGIELTAAYQNSIGRFNYAFAANWTQHNDRIDFMDEQDLSNDRYRHTGKSTNAIFGLQTNGFFTSRDEINQSPIVAGYDRNNLVPGDIKYVDQNNDNIIDQYDQVVIGGNKPLSTFGFDLNLEYCGLELSAFLQGVYNRDIYYSDEIYVSGFQGVNQGFGQAYETILNRWTPETANTATRPRLTAGGNSYNLQPNSLYSSLWVQSGNYIRLKNVTLAYTLPKLFSQSYPGGIKIKIFVSGQNLYTISACKGFDPEVVNFRNFPLTRGINTGINIKF